MDTGTTIRVMKSLHNITTDELAAQVGVSRFQVWRWEYGRTGVSPETIRKLEHALFNGNGARPDGGSEAA